jgi:hypothetical protein
MKPPRTALPLPRYVERKPLKAGGWAYFFHVPSKFKKRGCQLHDEPLGLDYAAAVARAETILKSSPPAVFANAETDSEMVDGSASTAFRSM